MIFVSSEKIWLWGNIAPHPIKLNGQDCQISPPDYMIIARKQIITKSNVFHYLYYFKVYSLLMVKYGLTGESLQSWHLKILVLVKRQLMNESTKKCNI